MLAPAAVAVASLAIPWSSGTERSAGVIFTVPGAELRRLTPRNNDDLLFDGVPWLERAQQEHDRFRRDSCASTRQVLYLDQLLTEVLAVDAARGAQLLDSALRPSRSARRSRPCPRRYLTAQPASELAEVLIAGMAREELPVDPGGCRGDGAAAGLRHPPAAEPAVHARLRGLARPRGRRHAARDARARAARARSPARSTGITRASPAPSCSTAGAPDQAWLEAGDVLVLAPGVLAVGIGAAARARPASRLRRAPVRRRGRRRRPRGADRPGTRDDAPRHRLHDGRPRRGRDVPAAGGLARGLRRQARARRGGRPFLAAAARAMGIDELRVIDTGLDPVTAEREQWDDGNNTLAIARPGAMAPTSATPRQRGLVQEGIEVRRDRRLRARHGPRRPRCMSCPVLRDGL